jgi:hypothetical protein
VESLPFRKEPSAKLRIDVLKSGEQTFRCPRHVQSNRMRPMPLRLLDDGPEIDFDTLGIDLDRELLGLQSVISRFE